MQYPEFYEVRRRNVKGKWFTKHRARMEDKAQEAFEKEGRALLEGETLELLDPKSIIQRRISRINGVLTNEV